MSAQSVIVVSAQFTRVVYAKPSFCSAQDRDLMLVTMTDKELYRLGIIQSVVEKRMRSRDAAHQLALTERQTQRLMNRFRESGAAGLVNLRRGRPGNHRVAMDVAAVCQSSGSRSQRRYFIKMVLCDIGSI